MFHEREMMFFIDKNTQLFNPFKVLVTCYWSFSQQTAFATVVILTCIMISKKDQYIAKSGSRPHF